MVALQIRDVPEEVRDKLTSMARNRGQSLQNYLLDLVTDEVRRRDNLAAIERLAGRFSTQISAEDVLNTLHGARAQRDAALGLPPEGIQ